MIYHNSLLLLLRGPPVVFLYPLCLQSLSAVSTLLHADTNNRPCVCSNNINMSRIVMSNTRINITPHSLDGTDNKIRHIPRNNGLMYSICHFGSSSSTALWDENGNEDKHDVKRLFYSVLSGVVGSWWWEYFSISTQQGHKFMKRLH